MFFLDEGFGRWISQWSISKTNEINLIKLVLVTKSSWWFVADSEACLRSNVQWIQNWRNRTLGSFILMLFCKANEFFLSWILINETQKIPGWPPGLGNPKEKHFKFNLRKGGAFRKIFAYFHFALNDFVAGSKVFMLKYLLRFVFAESKYAW